MRCFRRLSIKKTSAPISKMAPNAPPTPAAIAPPVDIFLALGIAVADGDALVENDVKVGLAVDTLNDVEKGIERTDVMLA